MQLLITLVTGLGTAFATAFFTSRFYARQARADLEKEFESRFNERKWTAYQQFGTLLKDVLSSAKFGRTEKDKSRFLRSFYEFLPQVWLVASDDVVRAFLDWRRSAAAATERDVSHEAIVELFDILVAMRRDLGYKETDLKPSELLGTFMDDVEHILVPASSR